MDGILKRCGPIFAIFVLFVHSVELSAQSNCTESHLSVCQDQFNDHENTLPICPEVLKLRRCLAVVQA